MGRRSFFDENYYRDWNDFQVLKLTRLLSENVVSEGEATLALGYLMGDSCLYRAACEEPHIAKEYLRAAEIIIETMKLLPQYVLLKYLWMFFKLNFLFFFFSIDN